MQVGEVFAGSYRIEAEVARGGMGVVYRALDLGLDRPVALKVMSAALSGDQGFRARFRREAALAARIDHPHVVPVFHRGEHEGVMYVVMRLVDGVDLAEVLAREGRLALDRTGRLMAQVGAALDAAHELGLVHRDVKPANILLQSGDRALLTDFGLAKQMSGDDALTSAGTLLGTAAYLAPEQAQGRAVGGSCDVYALACVTYHCLAGQPPYPDGPPVVVAASHVYDPVPDLAAVAPEVSPAVAQVVTRGLAKDPAERWPTAGAFTAALGQAIDTDRPRRGTAELAVLPPVNRRRSPGRWLVAAVVVVGLSVAAVVALSASDPPPARTSTPTAPATVDRHSALAARLPAAVYARCRPAPLREKKGVVTAVDCLASKPGADEILVSQWSGPAAMAADFQANYAARLPDGTCRSMTEVRSTWESGRLACYTNSGGAAVLLYEYDKTGLQVLALRKDGDRVQLYDWWHEQRLTRVG